jgi:hypothetical protein
MQSRHFRRAAHDAKLRPQSSLIEKDFPMLTTTQSHAAGKTKRALVDAVSPRRHSEGGHVFRRQTQVKRPRDGDVV